jgi:hypothetical protein
MTSSMLLFACCLLQAVASAEARLQQVTAGAAAGRQAEAAVAALKQQAAERQHELADLQAKLMAAKQAAEAAATEGVQLEGAAGSSSSSTGEQQQQQAVLSAAAAAKAVELEQVQQHLEQQLQQVGSGLSLQAWLGARYCTHVYHALCSTKAVI